MPAPIRTGKTILCLEVLQHQHREGAVRLVASLPGRESTLCYSWDCPGGIPDSGQFLDLQGRAGQLLVDAILMAGSGIQQQLI